MPLIKKLPFLSSQKLGRLVLWVDIPIYQLQFAETQDLNCLAGHGFLIERVVEESSYDEGEAAVFREGQYYSADRARLINPSFIVKARKC